jgi:hypothetical protein
MVKIPGKGCVLGQEIASVDTAIAQVISIDLPDMEAETFEADTLDNANAPIPYQTTERSEGGSWGGELFFDPVLAGHQAFLALLYAPVETNFTITYSDAGATVWTMLTAGVSAGGSIVLNDGVKMTVSGKLSGLPTEFSGY